MKVHLRIESEGFVSKKFVYEIDLCKDLKEKIKGKKPIAKRPKKSWYKKNKNKKNNIFLWLF